MVHARRTVRRAVLFEFRTVAGRTWRRANWRFLRSSSGLSRTAFLRNAQTGRIRRDAEAFTIQADRLADVVTFPAYDKPQARAASTRVKPHRAGTESMGERPPAAWPLCLDQVETTARQSVHPNHARRLTSCGITSSVGYALRNKQPALLKSTQRSPKTLQKERASRPS